MSRFNTSTNHPLIPNAQQYMFEKQYVSIHSEDRNIIKFPKSSEFEIELPQDYLNVQGIRLITSKFPTNLNIFSNAQQNISLTFQITNPYIPGTNPNPYNPILDDIFAALYNYIYKDFVINIEEGYYNPEQMVIELTNKFNFVVTNMILNSGYLTPTEQIAYIASGGYTNFIINYNEVTKKLWFGNKSDGFTLTNNLNTQVTYETTPLRCGQNILPEYSPWGLSWYIGLPRCNVVSVVDLSANTVNSATRFYYTNVSNGLWLVPDPTLYQDSCYYIEANYQVNLNGPLYMYMEIKGLNFIDETEPYNFSYFTMQSNQTNGIVKSAFAKIPILMPNENQWYEQVDGYKIYNPPAERIRKIYMKLRYHNGTLVDFGSSEYSFMLEFTLFRPQNAKNYLMYTPESIANSNAS